jgi:anaerobic selenocysteine-containing dehydrogenase
MPFLRQAQHAGCKVVVIDPRRTHTAESADWHLAPWPGSDGALAMGIGNILVERDWHDEAWLSQHSVGWPAFRRSLAEFPVSRVARMTGLSEEEIRELAGLYARIRPGLIKIADGINRNCNGGQNVRAICALPALTAQYGSRGGGLSYSTSGYFLWDEEAIHHWRDCPAPGRVVNMNRLGAALLGEARDPPIMALYVFGANPAASSPCSGRIIEGLLRDDLFTVVHELFMTDTADYADIVLPATSQLEHTDVHKAYGHTFLTYNTPAIAPLGECKSNWDVMRLLGAAMGYGEPWLRQSADEVIAEVIQASACKHQAFSGITLEQLKSGQPIPLKLETDIPFANGVFPTPSGRIELFSAALAGAGADPLPGRFREDQDDGEPNRLQATIKSEPALYFITGASHHFVSSSLANQEGLLRGEGEAILEIHPEDAALRRIGEGDIVLVQNGRGHCQLRARLTERVRRGVVASPKGRWHKLTGGRGVNWTTSDALADLAGQSTFHSNRVWVSPVAG